MTFDIVSPWIREMDDLMRSEPIDGNSNADIVIIGGGIAGISTAYYLLQNTECSVMLLERDRVGYGASGRNGGQGISSMELSFKDMLRAFDGATIAGMLNDLESGHERLKEICGEIGYRNGPIETTVWSGFSSIHEVQNYLEEMRLRSLFGAPVRPLIVEEGTLAKVLVPPGLEGLVSAGTLQEIMKVLHTRERYIAAYPAPVSLGNSGRLSRAIAQYLADKYPDRFVLHEKSPVVKAMLDDAVRLRANDHTVTAKIAVLCTNGYPLPEFESAERPRVASTLRRYVASMVAHESEEKKAAGAFIYYHDDGDPEEEPYFYLTRRSFLVNGKDLVTVGGPQQQISEILDHHAEYPDGIYQRIEGFLDRSYPERLDGQSGMRWNGLMGYTADGTRMIGPDPKIPCLWYNMGCNGVGFLYSIVGGKKVAERVKGMWVKVCRDGETSTGGE